MLVYNHFWFNASIKDSKNKNMTLKNDFKIERYLATYKIQNSKFIILSRYIIFQTIIIITFILLKYASNKKFLATFF